MQGRQPASRATNPACRLAFWHVGRTHESNSIFCCVSGSQPCMSANQFPWGDFLYSFLAAHPFCLALTILSVVRPPFAASKLTCLFCKLELRISQGAVVDVEGWEWVHDNDLPERTPHTGRGFRGVGEPCSQTAGTFVFGLQGFSAFVFSGVKTTCIVYGVYRVVVLSDQL